MAWTTPMTAVANAAYSAAQHNAGVRDNFLTTFPALATTAGSIAVATGANAIAERVPTANTIPTSQSVASASYTNLTTPGPTVGPLTTGPRALIITGCEMSNGSSGVSSYMGYDVSGSTTVAATDTTALKSTNASGYPLAMSRALLQGLTPGSNTFVAKYRADGASTGTWLNRTINLVPF
jgi:hypothetical protein